MAAETAWLFPGQGSQSIGMAGDLLDHPVARETLEAADTLLGVPLSRMMAEGPKEALDDTLNTQPALYVHSVALVRVALAEGWLEPPAWAAGHSLGEYSALTAAGALSFEAGLQLVRARGRLMQEAGTRAPGGMAAIIALEDEAVAELCAAASREGEVVQVANYNCPGQVVISGADEAVARASEAASKAGARMVVRLDVSIAAHSPLMASAQEEFAALVAETPIQPPDFPVIANVSTQPLRDAEAIRAELVAQLTGPVRWTDTIRFLQAQGVERFVEIGAGSVLSGLLKRIDRKAARQDVATVAALRAAASTS